jgi:hypothetical protein
MLSHPIPRGWIKLQERAQSTKNPEELVRIIAEMNKVLDENEAKHAKAERKSRTTKSDGGQSQDR